MFASIAWGCWACPRKLCGHSLAHVGERLDLLDLQHDWCTDLTGMVPSDEDFLMDVVSFSAK